MKKAPHGKLQFAALSLVSALVILTMATPSSAASDCGICHGVALTDMRPLDTSASLSSYRNITSGAIKGNHQTHMPSVVPSTPSATAGGACIKCHGNTVGYTPNGTAHRNGTINFSANINNSPTAGQYGGGITFKNQTSVPNLSTCANVNCHFTTTTPTWGATTFASQKTAAGADGSNTCQACHATGALTSVHARHLTYYNNPGPVNGCVKCHPDNDLTDKFAFAHATSLAANIRTSFAAAPNSGSGIISGQRTTTQFLTGGSTAGVTCSALYCHSDGTKASGFTATSVPAWSGTLTCASCHGGAVGSASQITTNSHNVHVNGVALGRTNANITCDKCHNTTTADGTTILTMANHANKIIDVKMASGTYSADGLAPAHAVGTCAATTCHNPGKVGVTPAALTVTWGTNTNPNKCAICHGTTNAIGSPDYASTGGGVANANSHVMHAITKGISCAVCHNSTTNTGTTITGATHLDGNINVTYGTFNGQAQALASYSSSVGKKTCANTYCHGPARSTAWGTLGPLACNSCHGDSAVPGTLTGKHSVHMGTNIPYYRGTNSSIGCVECHSNVVLVNTAINNQANHANGIKNYSGARAYRSQYVTGGDNTCATYCHSNGKGTNASPGGWITGAAISDCKGCHGKTGTSLYGEPDYASGTAGSATANSHLKHVTAATTCNFCHRLTAGSSAGTIVTNSTEHLDGAISARLVRVNGFTTYSGVYNPTVSIKTCTATYCHGNGNTTPSWGGASLACNQCHSANSSLPGAHSTHYASTTLPSKYTTMSGNVSTVGAYRFSCGACHSSAAGAVHANGANDANGAAQVFYGFTSATMKGGTYNYGGLAGTDPTGSFNWSAGGSGTCSTTYCHSDGNGGGAKKPVFNWASPAGTLRCFGCHGAQDIKNGTAQSAMTNYSAIRTNAHARHVRPDINIELGYGNGLTCNRCHAATVTAAMNSYSTVGAGVLQKNRHVNKIKNYSGATPNPNGGAAVSSGQINASKVCSNVYCHSNNKVGISNGVGNIGYYANPDAWNSGVANKKCNYCHGRNDASTQYDITGVFPRYTSTGVPNYATGPAGSTSANSHRQHVLVLGTTDYSNTNVCYNCHSATLDSTTGQSNTAAKFRAYSSRHVSGSYNVKMKAAIGGNYSGAIGKKTCASINCHGTGVAAVSPKWGGNNDANSSCTKCHGKPTVLANYSTATAAQSAPGFGQVGLNLARVTGTFTNGVSNNAQVGAHDAHLRAINGYTGRKVLCNDCHVVPASVIVNGSDGHLDGGATKMTWSNFANNSSTTGRPSLIGKLATNYSAGVCNNTYCHGASMVGGSATAPSWNDTTYLASYTKDATNCGRCHGAPPTSAPANFTHGGYTIASPCTGCHGHEGSGPNHINGILTGAGGACDGCHDLDNTGVPILTNGIWTGGSWGKAPNQDDGINQGWGAHAKHINVIKSRLGLFVSMSTTGTFGTSHAAKVCGTCHTNNVANHNTSGGIGDSRKINFGDANYKVGPTGTPLLFGAAVPFYNGSSNSASAAKSKTCSNLSCHYFTSPNW